MEEKQCGFGSGADFIYLFLFHHFHIQYCNYWHNLSGFWCSASTVNFSTGIKALTHIWRIKATLIIQQPPSPLSENSYTSACLPNYKTKKSILNVKIKKWQRTITNALLLTSTESSSWNFSIPEPSLQRWPAARKASPWTTAQIGNLLCKAPHALHMRQSQGYNLYFNTSLPWILEHSSSFMQRIASHSS